MQGEECHKMRCNESRCIVISPIPINCYKREEKGEQIDMFYICIRDC